TDLESDGVCIRRAVPAIAIRRCHLAGVAPPERIFRLGEGAYHHPAYFARNSQDLLDNVQRSHTRLVLSPAGVQNAAHMQLLSLYLNLIANADAVLARQRAAGKH